MSDLSTRVRLRREQLGLSQEELARRMGYRSRSSITKLEKGIPVQGRGTGAGAGDHPRRPAGAGRTLRLSPGL